jgi:hypothetical protein
MTIEEQNKELINEVEQLIMHAEDGTLDYSVLEHARKLVFHLSLQNEEKETLSPKPFSESELTQL